MAILTRIPGDLAKNAACAESGSEERLEFRTIEAKKLNGEMVPALIDLQLAVVRGETMAGTNRIFLTAEWRDLVMLNYEVNARLLYGYVPAGTELDFYGGKTYVSLVGFRFCGTKLWGKITIPFHEEFEEVNLRFYVRRPNGAEERRGVCFIKENVPKPLIAWAARFLYGENYVRSPMAHRIDESAVGKRAEYGWRAGGRLCTLFAEAARGEMTYPREASLEQFIAEHYWGYSRQPSVGSLEYRVAHVPWRVAAATNAGFAGDAKGCYGADFAEILGRKPDSAFLADGSSVEVFSGVKIG
jgi:uncharacterized protein YqjF (DUF2071 family)